MIQKNHSIPISPPSHLSVVEYCPIKKKCPDFETIFLLNSSFFNQKQWDNGLKAIFSLLPENHQYRFITYDYIGVGKSDYIKTKILISSFIDEFIAILEYFNLKKVHIYGMSIGSWIGLNLCVFHPERVKSFIGYGNLAPYLPNFKSMRMERFDIIKDSFPYLEKLQTSSINLDNWPTLFNQFYIPVFFNHLFTDISDQKTNNAKKILARIIFPLVQGNKIALIQEYYEYIVNTMISEGIALIPLLSHISSDVPIMFINGADDPIANPYMSRDLHSKIEHSQLEILPNLGHGSVILGKGNKKIMKLVLKFIENL